ncbi:MAG TPA: ATP-binding cassette domain-containing protein [Candidatus Baltobacteraceae bacterium]|jgi:polar amino acid transport system ATP-binding protein|nr:ATP-binding cassette domain-containing protein [Candidatus Baltobacteraceae bacterium]
MSNYSPEPDNKNETHSRRSIDSPALLTASEISRTSGTQLLLHNISFQLHQGEILGIIGPSGSGKTTLLRCLNMLDPISQGSISFYGDPPLTISPHGKLEIPSEKHLPDARALDRALSNYRQHVGMVFQHFNLWGTDTVLQNLTLAPIVVRGETRQRAAHRAQEVCGQLGLEDKLHVPVWKLSGGERQRVAIIRALMMDPKVLLLDEITSALDPVLTAEVLQTIRQLQLRGMTMILVTHHLEFAASICNRIMFLSGGSILQIDTPNTLRTSPASPAVEQFIAVLRSVQ